MRRSILFVILMFLTTVQLVAQYGREMNAILKITGAASPEEIDVYELERLESMIDRPLRLNYMSSSRLVSSGLFTTYQAASLTNYRKQHGDIMSISELAAVDGFSKDFVTGIEPFISLEGGSLSMPGKKYSVNELAVRSAVKLRAETRYEWNYGLRYSLETMSGLSAGLALSRSYDNKGPYPDSFSCTLDKEFRKVPLRILVGDFNLRYGQGLALWNGMTINGLSAPSSFMRKPSGVSRTSSFTGNYAFTGLAVSIISHHITLNGAIALPDIKKFSDFTILPSLNLVWNHRSGQIGFTHYVDFMKDINDMKSSVDVAWCVAGTDFFAEFVFDWESKLPAAIAGVSFPIGESFRAGAMLRAYPSSFDSSRCGAQRSTTECSNEYAGTLAAEFLSPARLNSAAFSVDIAYFPESKSVDPVSDAQIKLAGCWKRTTDRFTFKVRLTERMRTWGEKFHTEIRTDASVMWQRWSLNTRFNLLHCKGVAGLGYAEVEYDFSHLSAHIRSGVFSVDNWEDRIYVYERDAPGGFNVPAMYGRGVWFSAVASCKIGRVARIYARFSCTSYPFMPAEKEKPGKAELKLQCVLSF